MSITFQYDVPDVVCGNCSNTIEKTLKASLFFKDQLLGVDPIDKKLTITIEDEHLSYLEILDLLNEVLEPVGFSCVEISKNNQKNQVKKGLSHRMKGIIGVSVGILFILLSFLTGSFSLMWLTTLVSFPLTLYLGAESYQKAWKKLKTGTLTMDSLFAISTLTILTLSVTSLFFPALPMMCEAGLLIFGFRHIGLAVEQVFKGHQVISQRFQDDAPQQVRVIRKEQTILVPLSSVQKNDILWLSEGDIIPVDGWFEDTDGLISDLIVTGSHMPHRIHKEDQVYAGSILLQASKNMRFRAAATAATSHLARLDIKIARAKLEKSTLETATNRILQYFIPTIFAISIISGIAVSLFFTPLLGIQCAIAVLVSACPCTLGLITPLAIRIGIKKAADAGVVFNSAKKLELTEQAQCVVFDLNGTLTQGMPRVIRYRASLDSGLTHDELLNIMAHLEKGSTHPVAKAIQKAAITKKLTTPTSDIAIESTDHAGRIIDWEGHRYVIGSESLMIQQGVAEHELENLRKTANLQATESIIFLTRSKRLIGYVVLHDSLRNDAVEVITTLKKMGKKPYLCTGADLKTALQYAKKLGIPAEQVRANCVSHANSDSVRSKKNVLDELRKKGYYVAAVGDGGNDAEMIAAADIGFAMSASGDRHAQQQAAAVIHGNSLLPVLHAFSISKRTVFNIKENLIFSLLYNLATLFLTSGLLLAVGVALNPAIGAGLMIFQTSLILLNVFRYARQPAILSSIPTSQPRLVVKQPSVLQLLSETSKPLNHHVAKTCTDSHNQCNVKKNTLIDMNPLTQDEPRSSLSYR